MEKANIYESSFVMVSGFSWTHILITFLLLFLNICVFSEGHWDALGF